MAWTWAYLNPAFLSLRCTYKDWTILKVFPIKTSEAFQIGTEVWKKDGKEIEYLWVKENLIVP